MVGSCAYILVLACWEIDLARHSASVSFLICEPDILSAQETGSGK